MITLFLSHKKGILLNTKKFLIHFGAADFQILNILILPEYNSLLHFIRIQFLVTSSSSEYAVSYYFNKTT